MKTARSRGNVLIVVVIALFVILVIVSTLALKVLLQAEHLAHPPVVIPEENRASFARVAILMDGTRSVGTQNYVTIQEIVQEKIIPALGANDVAMAYDVQPRFTFAENKVFGLSKDEMPRDQAAHRRRILEILERNRGNGEPAVVDEPMYDLLRSLVPRQRRVTELREDWARRVRERPQPAELGSDICGSLRELGQFLSGGDPGEERWMFVLSDLQNDTTAKSCAGEEPFPEANIVLVYPFSQESRKWGTVESFWRELFGGQELRRATFSVALADGLLLPPNPLEGLAEQAPKTVWEHAKPLARPAVRTLLIASLLIGAVAALAGMAFARLSGTHGRQDTPLDPQLAGNPGAPAEGRRLRPRQRAGQRPPEPDPGHSGPPQGGLG